MVTQWALSYFPCEGVLYSSSANNEYIHGHAFRCKDTEAIAFSSQIQWGIFVFSKRNLR